MASADPAVVAREIACLASTVADGAINVNVVSEDPTQGTTSPPDGGIATNGTINVPQDWSSFTVTNLIASTDSVLINGSFDLPPGVSFSHGSWEGFPGDPFDVTSPNIGTSALVTWVIATPTP